MTGSQVCSAYPPFTRLPEPDQAILLQQLKLTLPTQPPLRITAAAFPAQHDPAPRGADLGRGSREQSAPRAILPLDFD
jgi:hypothetical protein